jgi:CRISP-associated protein Cas1
MIRAQAKADPLPIARIIVAAKIEAMRHAGALERGESFAPLSAMSLKQVRLIEAQASRAAWPHSPALKWDKGPIPIDWRSPWLMRTRLDAKGKRGARHPVNAMLNAAFAVTAGRLAAYLSATGFAPVIGFLHADKRGRWSLAWDAIEVLRPAIEARVFALIEREWFALDDFVRAPDGSVRLASTLLSMVLNECAPSAQSLARCVRWIMRLVLSSADESRADNAKECLRHLNGLRLPA